MKVIYHEALPQSYLLVLAPGVAVSATELASHLRRACRSGKAAVWVDCRLLDDLSAPAARLLWACHLRRRHVRLVLCRVCEDVEQTLRLTFAGPAPGLCLVPMLDDAAGQGGL
ncbi:hypothetical protein [uncultured Hymenobacter sp.]|uniref:hypothetical protein n=1 Tax=uncultured Hymenobacter sp. TaxID=170016 RepID=UPI0035CA7E10